MPRPRLRRWVASTPKATYFKPQGIPLSDLEEIRLSVEGLEALRLADLNGLTTDAAAVGMGVSRHTFGRVLTTARATVAKALVTGAALRIEGGNYQLADRPTAAITGNANEPAGYLVAVPSRGENLEAPFDCRFGRAAGFVLLNFADMTTRYLENDNRSGPGRGAGAQAVRRLLAAGVNVLLTCRLNPKLHEFLSHAGVKVITNLEELEGQTVDQVVRQFAASMSAASGQLGTHCNVEAFIMRQGCVSQNGQGGGQGRCGQGQGQGQGQGRGQGQGGRGGKGGGQCGQGQEQGRQQIGGAAGTTQSVVGQCACPKCGQVVPHAPGNACVNMQCPTCGAAMARQ